MLAGTRSRKMTRRIGRTRGEEFFFSLLVELWKSATRNDAIAFVVLLL